MGKLVLWQGDRSRWSMIWASPDSVSIYSFVRSSIHALMQPCIHPTMHSFMHSYPFISIHLGLDARCEALFPALVEKSVVVVESVEYVLGQALEGLVAVVVKARHGGKVHLVSYASDVIGEFGMT